MDSGAKFIIKIANGTRDVLDEWTEFDLHLCLCESDGEQTAAWWLFLNYVVETLDDLEVVRKYREIYPSVCNELDKLIVEVRAISEKPFTKEIAEFIKTIVESLASEVFEVEHLVNIEMDRPSAT